VAAAGGKMAIAGVGGGAGGELIGGGDEGVFSSRAEGRQLRLGRGRGGQMRAAGAGAGGEHADEL